VNYIELINNFWRKHEEHPFGTVAGLLYFHLLDVSNKQNWRNPFKRQNTRVCGDLGITNPTLIKARNELKQRGMINFFSKGKGDSNVEYQLNNDKYLHTSLTTSFHTPFNTSYHLNNTKTETEKREVITCTALSDFFWTTSICRTLTEQYNIDLQEKIKIFYEEKHDLGELNSKTKEDLLKNFRNWLPIHLRILSTEKEKSCAQKEKQPRRGDKKVIEVFTATKFRG